MLIEENADGFVERIEGCEIIVEKSKCLKTFLFSLLIVADEYRVRLEIAVDILVYLKIILIESTFGYAQTCSVAAVNTSLRMYGFSDNLLYLEFELG